VVSSPIDSARWAVMDEASTMYFALRGDPNRDALTVAYLLSNDAVHSAGVSDSAGNVWACFDDDRVALLIDKEFSAPEPPRLTRSALQRAERSAFGPGSELPVSKKAQLMNALEARWHNSCPAISSMLTTSGYQCTSPAATLEKLVSVDDLGVFYFASHAGTGEDRQGGPVFGIWTSSPGDSNLDKLQPARSHWADRELCYAWCEVQQADGSLKKECHYAISANFIRNEMSFPTNSLVFIDACTSLKEEIRAAFWDKGASVYCGWNDLTSGSSYLVSETFFDLLCGTDDVNPQYPRQRPFLFDWVRDWMIQHGENLDPSGNAVLSMNRNPASPQFGLLRPTIFRMYVHDAASDPVDYLEIEGDFGLDPGAADREVKIGGAAFANVIWSEHIILVDNFPRTGQGSYGDVVVSVRGHTSNTAHLTRWNLPVKYIEWGPGSLQKQFNLNFIVRGDADQYRNIPYVTPTGFAHAITAAKSSTGSYLMSGIYQPDPDHFTKWTGSGTLEGAKTIPQVNQAGYIRAFGNVNPNPRTISSWVNTAWAEYTIEKESGSSQAIAGLVPFSFFTVSFNSSYVIQSDSLGPVNSGDGSAKIWWGPASPDAPFNNGGR